MPFFKGRVATGTLESAGPAIRDIHEAIGVAETRHQLMAVAILSNMERQGRTLAVVIQPYAYAHPVKATDIVVNVPVGFVTDFASIPPLAQILIQPFGRHAPAAVVHDYLYAVGASRARKYADLLFRQAMREAGVAFVRRWLMYLAVRLGGKKGYGLPNDWQFVSPADGSPASPTISKDAAAGWADLLLVRKTRKSP